MPGSLALVGSGEYLPKMAEFEKSLLDDGIRAGMSPVYVQIPTAAGQESEQRIQYWRELGEKQAEILDTEVRFIPIFDRESANNPEIVSAITGSALIYLSGGDPHFLANTLRGTLAWELIEENWRRGGSLAGCSAGAMVMSTHIPNFRITTSDPTEGLALIPGLRVIPHFNKFFKWIPESAAKLLLEVPEDSILLGIDEMTALTRRSGKDDWEVYGDAQVHILKGMPVRRLAHEERIFLSLSS